MVNQYIRFELKKATIIASVNLVDKKENKWRWEIDEYKATGLVSSKEEALEIIDNILLNDRKYVLLDKNPKLKVLL